MLHLNLGQAVTYRQSAGGPRLAAIVTAVHAGGLVDLSYFVPGVDGAKAAVLVSASDGNEPNSCSPLADY